MTEPAITQALSRFHTASAYSSVALDLHNKNTSNDPVIQHIVTLLRAKRDHLVRLGQKELSSIYDPPSP